MKTEDFRIKWLECFPNGEFDTTSFKKKLRTRNVSVSIDTEYAPDANGNKNSILSYQYSVYNFYNGRYTEGIIYVDYENEERKSFDEILLTIVEKVGIKGAGLNGYRVIVIAHFLVAEFCAFNYDDRNKFVEELKVIHKTLVSTNFFKYSLYTRNRNKIDIKLRFCDTILLLPESYKSLMKASSFISEKKLDIDESWKKNMIGFLKHDPILFEKYAILDAVIALKLFIKLMVYLNELSCTKSMIYSTLSSASCRLYKRNIRSFFRFKELDLDLLYPSNKRKFSSKVLRKYENLANMGYMGGLNNSYKIGKSQGAHLDIDLSSCYATAMYLLHMYEPKESSIAQVIKAIKDFDGRELVIGCADVTFSFPKNCRFPNLSIRDDSYGLVQVLEGRTIATIPELCLALKIGAKLEYHDGFVFKNLYDEDGEKIPLFESHVRTHVQKRDIAREQGNDLKEQLLKTYNNGLYGKLAQGLRSKSSFDYKYNCSKQLEKSSISNPYLAMTITGFIRTVLSSIILSIDSLDGYEVISATTDGVLYKTPFTDFSLMIKDDVLNDKYDADLKKAFKKGKNDFIKPFADIDRLLHDKVLEYPSVKLYDKASREITDKGFLEVKHIAETVTNYKTRGQTGSITIDNDEIVTIMARAGHKMHGSKEDQLKQLEEWACSDSVDKNEYESLAGIRDILDSTKQVIDLVNIPKKVNVNLDYDYKRQVINVNGNTLPFQNIDEFRKHRNCAEYIRKKGYRATVNSVGLAVERAKQGVVNRGTKNEMVLRHFLRGLVHEIPPFKKINGTTYHSIANILEEYGVTKNSLKNAKRKKFSPNVISNDRESRRLIRALVHTLGFDKSYYQKFYDLLLYKGISNFNDIDVEELNNGK